MYTTALPNRYGAGQPVRATQGYAPMGVAAALRYRANPNQVARSGMQGLTFDGTGLLGTGLFSSGLDMSQWTWAEWMTVAVGGYLAFAMFNSSAKERRKELSQARLDYRKRVAEIVDKYPRVPHPKAAFGL